MSTSLDHGHLAKLFRENQIQFTEDDLLYILRRCDLDKDGEINYREFINCITPFTMLRAATAAANQNSG